MASESSPVMSELYFTFNYIIERDRFQRPLGVAFEGAHLNGSTTNMDLGFNNAINVVSAWLRTDQQSNGVLHCTVEVVGMLARSISFRGNGTFKHTTNHTIEAYLTASAQMGKEVFITDTKANEFTKDRCLHCHFAATIENFIANFISPFWFCN